MPFGGLVVNRVQRAASREDAATRSPPSSAPSSPEGGAAPHTSCRLADRDLASLSG